MAGSPKACPPCVTPFMGQFAGMRTSNNADGTPNMIGNTPGLLSHNSPSAFSPRLGSVNDFASMYFRAMLGFASHPADGQLPQSPGCYRPSDGAAFSPSDQLHGFGLPNK